MPARPLPRYGRLIEETSIVDGQPSVKKTYHEEPMPVDGLVHCMTRVSEIVKDGAASQNNKIAIEITFDHVTHEPKLVKTKYLVGREDLA